MDEFDNDVTLRKLSQEEAVEMLRDIEASVDGKGLAEEDLARFKQRCALMKHLIYNG